MALNSLKQYISKAVGPLQTLTGGRKAIIATRFMVVYLALTSLWVYFDTQNLLAFLLFLASALLIYYLPMRSKAKVVISLVAALIIVPVLVIRNIFYLEVMFQICLFSSLALGLNIVVGFTGLLNLGYVAFYAVGAYTLSLIHISEPTRLGMISYAVFCLKKKKHTSSPKA